MVARQHLHGIHPIRARNSAPGTLNPQHKPFWSVVMDNPELRSNAEDSRWLENSNPINAHHIVVLQSCGVEHPCLQQLKFQLSCSEAVDLVTMEG